MPMLPQLNQQAQGLNVQRPQVPSAQQGQARTQSMTAPAMGERPFASMAPDNGQHGGAPRYQTPTSGAQNHAVSRAMPTLYQGGTQPRPQPQAAPQGANNPRPAVFDPQRLQQTTQMLQNSMPFNQALQQRFMAQQNPQPDPPAQQPLPPMFYR